jgi:hypothetical protein
MKTSLAVTLYTAGGLQRERPRRRPSSSHGFDSLDAALLCCNRQGCGGTSMTNENAYERFS